MILEYKERTGFIDATKESYYQHENEHISEHISEHINLTDKAVLEAIRLNPRITNEELAATLGKSRATITRSIKKLRETRRIIRIGANKSGYWEIA